MDFFKIKSKTIDYSKVLFKNNIRPDIIILFGSHATGKAKKESDVDLAVVSRDLGKNRIKEGALLNKLLSDVFPEAEVIPISLNEYFSKTSISPILHEIKKMELQFYNI